VKQSSKLSCLARELASSSSSHNVSTRLQERHEDDLEPSPPKKKVAQQELAALDWAPWVSRVEPATERSVALPV